MKASEALALLELVRGIWPNQQLGEDTAKSWAFIMSDVTTDEAAAAVKAIASSGVSEFPPNPTKILDAVKAARPKSLWISPNVDVQANTETYKLGDRYYVRATSSGRAEYVEAMRKHGMERVVTGHYVRSDGKREVSYVYRKI